MERALGVCGGPPLPLDHAQRAIPLLEPETWPRTEWPSLNAQKMKCRNIRLMCLLYPRT
jgi:hypothetical protein